MTSCGLVLAGLLIFFPHSARISAFRRISGCSFPWRFSKRIAFARGRGAPGSVIAIWTRLIGFVIAIALMMLVPYLAGRPVVQIF